MNVQDFAKFTFTTLHVPTHTLTNTDTHLAGGGGGLG